MKKELCSKIEEDIIAQGQSITTEDVDTLVLKQDKEVEFGLKIKQRKHKKLTFFEFNIEKTISVSQFQQFCDLSLDSDTLITDFLRQNFILKLNVFKPSLDGDDKHQEWRERAL